MRKIAALLLATASLSCRAVLLVDTGEPTGLGFSLTLDPSQSVATSFSAATSATITGVEGFFYNLLTGTLALRLYEGASPTGQLLHSAIFELQQGEPSWQSMSGLRWEIAPGAYTVAFEPISYFGAVVPGGVPNPVGQDWRTEGSNWIPAGSGGIGLRVHAAMIPEPSSIALLLAGGVLILLVTRRRTASSPTELIQ